MGVESLVSGSRYPSDSSYSGPSMSVHFVLPNIVLEFEISPRGRYSSSVRNIC